jgi:predicted nucleic-acid-binding Zn-ribbon protein
MTTVVCPTCGGTEFYRAIKPISAGGGYAPNLLPGLGTWRGAEQFHVVLCANCGLTRLFARQEALEKLPTSSKWERVS